MSGAFTEGSAPQTRANATDLDAPTLERIVQEALRRMDWPGVDAALSLLAVRDPKRCAQLIGLVRVALDVGPSPAGPFNFDAMTWTCMVCGDERPDALISVARRSIEAMEDLFPHCRWNVRYCNDRPECAGTAHALGPWRPGASA